MRSTEYRARRAQPRAFTARVKVWLEVDGAYVFGFGLSQILDAVLRAGSIKQGASDLGKSYRYVWGRIKSGEKVLGMQLVETKVGGQGVLRSTLTPKARQLVKSFSALRQRMQELTAQEFSRQFSRHFNT